MSPAEHPYRDLSTPLLIDDGRPDVAPRTVPVIDLKRPIESPPEMLPPSAVTQPGSPAPLVAAVLLSRAGTPQETPQIATLPIDSSAPVRGVTMIAPAEIKINPGRVTPAETAFRLRLRTTETAGQPAVPAAFVPITDPAMTKPVPLKPAVLLPTPTADQTSEKSDAPDNLPAPDLPAAAMILLSEPGLTSPAIGLADSVNLTRPAPPHTSGAAMAAPPPANALPPRLTTDLVALTKSPPNGPVEILLNPAELGQLRFEIQHKGDQLRVMLSVERPETMDLLRRNADQLLGEFRSAGFAGASLSFGQWDQQGHNPRATLAPPPPPPQDWAFDPPLPTRPLPSSPEMAVSTGLNIRL